VETTKGLQDGGAKGIRVERTRTCLAANLARARAQAEHGYEECKSSSLGRESVFGQSECLSIAVKESLLLEWVSRLGKVATLRSPPVALS
jgi:hypothetical protein